MTDELRRAKKVVGNLQLIRLPTPFRPLFAFPLDVANMRATLPSIILFMSAACFAADSGFDLKGIALGASEADVTARFPTVTCRDRGTATAERLCTVLKDSYSGAEAGLFFSLIGGKVSNMSARFNSRDFANVVAAMKERFGPPSSEEIETVSNRMGVQFQNQMLTWIRSGEIVVARRFAGSLDRASVTFISKAFIQEFERRHGNERRERAKDL